MSKLQNLSSPQSKPHVSPLLRVEILPEPELPDVEGLIAEGKRLSTLWAVGPCPFLSNHGVPTEAAYKRAMMSQGRVMLHAQIGYRDTEKSQRAYADIYETLDSAGWQVDRYGICLDWSMGYPQEARDGMPRGTGLLLEEPEDFAALTARAPVAPHFGDFVIGLPAAVENTCAALAAGATTIGNLGQYFTFRMPLRAEDVETTAATVTALALIAAQPVEILVHSNLDDGFAALFTDLGCSLGAVLIERHIVDTLLGARVVHCFGNTFSEPLKRIAFQRALALVETEDRAPGSMIYGNTTIYTADEIGNAAALASYISADIHAQMIRPTGHALNPVPLTEAKRIPEIEEVIDAHRIANRLIERAEMTAPLFSLEQADLMAGEIVAAGKLFCDRVLIGLGDAGFDTGNPFELLLAIRRIGAKRLEELYGPGRPDPDVLRGRVPVVKAATITDLERRAEQAVQALTDAERAALADADLTLCLATTDVHEYAKTMLEAICHAVGAGVVDAGVSVDPQDVIAAAKAGDAQAIAISTYNGVALEYVQRLRVALTEAGVDIPVFIGGRMNQVPEGSNSSLPVDVTAELAGLGMIVCDDPESMLRRLAHDQTDTRTEIQ